MTVEDIFVSATDRPELQGTIPLERLAEYPLMMLEKNNISRDYIDHYLKRTGHVLEPEIEISSMDFLIDLASAGLSIALVIKNFVREELKKGELFELDVRPAIPARQVGVVVAEHLPLSMAAETFIEFICQHVA